MSPLASPMRAVPVAAREGEVGCIRQGWDGRFVHKESKVLRNDDMPHVA